MTARLSLDPPLASADSWAARKAPSLQHDAHCADHARDWLVAGMEKEQRGAPHKDECSRPALAAAHAALESQAKETAAWLATQHRDGIIPPAEHIVLDCLRALQAIPTDNRMYADELVDMIAKGYLDTAWGAKTSRRRVAALLRIAAEAR